MSLWIIIPVIIAILLAVLLLSRARIEFLYKLEGLEDYSLLVFSAIGGLVKYRYRLPSKKHKKVQEKEVEKSKIQGVHDKINNLNEAWKIIQLVKIYLGEKIFLKRIELETEIGTGDAYWTGILNGSAWAAMGILLSYIANEFRTDQTKLAVCPNFNEKKFTGRIHCIFTIQIVHIIVVSCKLFFHQRKKKMKLKGGDISVGTSD